uniref:Uncharacterized protein n=1 Tax=Pyrodinium bahamense TaxID=73915 RepID=A0A7S0AAM5_9DINO
MMPAGGAARHVQLAVLRRRRAAQMGIARSHSTGVPPRLGSRPSLTSSMPLQPDAMVEAEVRRFRVLVIGFARVAMIFSSPGMLRAGVVGTGTQTLGTPASKINWVECPTALLASDVKHPALVLLLLAWRCAPVIGSARDVMTMSLRRTVRVGDVAHQDRPPMAMGMGSSLSPAVRRA